MRERESEREREPRTDTNYEQTEVEIINVVRNRCERTKELRGGGIAGERPAIGTTNSQRYRRQSTVSSQRYEELQDNTNSGQHNAMEAISGQQGEE